MGIELQDERQIPMKLYLCRDTTVMLFLELEESAKKLVITLSDTIFLLQLRLCFQNKAPMFPFKI